MRAYLLHEHEPDGGYDFGIIFVEQSNDEEKDIKQAVQCVPGAYISGNIGRNWMGQLLVTIGMTRDTLMSSGIQPLIQWIHSIEEDGEGEVCSELFFLIREIPILSSIPRHPLR